MNALVDTLRFINLFSAAILAGSLAFEFVVVVPGLKGMTTDMGGRVHQIMLGALPDRLLPPAGGISGASAILLIILSSHLRAQATAFYIVGTIFWAILFYSTFFVSRPINKRIGRWTLDQGVPADYPEILSGFQRVHALRTGVGMLGLICFCLAAVLD